MPYIMTDYEERIYTYLMANPVYNNKFNKNNIK